MTLVLFSASARRRSRSSLSSSLSRCAALRSAQLCQVLIHVSSSSYDMYPPPHMTCILLLICVKYLYMEKRQENPYKVK